jgi:hypothetical protein
LSLLEGLSVKAKSPPARYSKSKAVAVGNVTSRPYGDNKKTAGYLGQILEPLVYGLHKFGSILGKRGNVSLLHGV